MASPMPNQAPGLIDPRPPNRDPLPNRDSNADLSMRSPNLCGPGRTLGTEACPLRHPVGSHLVPSDPEGERQGEIMEHSHISDLGFLGFCVPRYPDPGESSDNVRTRMVKVHLRLLHTPPLK
jgi:hypothetical protein